MPAQTTVCAAAVTMLLPGLVQAFPPKSNAPRCAANYKCPEPCFEDRYMDCNPENSGRVVVCCETSGPNDGCYSDQGMERYNSMVCCGEKGTNPKSCGVSAFNVTPATKATVRTSEDQSAATSKCPCGTCMGSGTDNCCCCHAPCQYSYQVPPCPCPTAGFGAAADTSCTSNDDCPKGNRPADAQFCYGRQKASDTGICYGCAQIRGDCDALQGVDRDACRARCM